MIELVRGGDVTSARGFAAGGTYAGLKTAGDGVLDLGILKSEIPARVAGTFARGSVLSPSVTLSKDRVGDGRARAVVANSGCANCCVGEQGLRDAEEMAALAATHSGIPAEEMLVCSTGVIGVELPMALIRQNIGNVGLNKQGGNEFARAIMTTDTRAKELAVTVEVSGRRVTLGGAAKGVGMIHPDMATMLAFIATDADAEASFLQRALREAVDTSFNMIDVDGDTSTNDTVLAFANGAGGGQEIREGTEDARAFQEALTYVCTALAKEMVRDAEGARRLMEVVVEGAASREDARAASREVAGSLLVKTMVHGRDPNWGRVMAALGKSRIDMAEAKVDLFINDIHIVHEGRAFSFLKEAVISSMSGDEVCFRVDLHEGSHSATAWGCDLTEEYVVFNSAYST